MAMSITRNAGARWFLTSENEWYKAAYLRPRARARISNIRPAATRYRRKMLLLGGSNSANYFVSRPDGGGDLTNVVAYTETKSPYGAFDMGGNVYERNEALHWRLVSGLAWRFVLQHATELASGPGNDAITSHAHYTIGFRVASVPEPTSLCLAVFLGDRGGFAEFSVVKCDA